MQLPGGASGVRLGELGADGSGGAVLWLSLDLRLPGSTHSSNKELSISMRSCGSVGDPYATTVFLGSRVGMVGGGWASVGGGTEWSL